MNELDRYFQTYNPSDIPSEEIAKDVTQISAFATQAFFEYLRYATNMTFNYDIAYDPFVVWNNQQIMIQNSFVQELPPNVVSEVREKNREILFPLFDYIIAKLNEESDKRHGKFRFFIQGIHITPVLTNKQGIHVAGAMLKYVPIQVSW